MTFFPILNVFSEWISDIEALGSKRKFWYRDAEDGSEWLFKFPQEGTGQHWAEKIAAEVAKNLGIPHGRVEFALYGDVRGSATESFVLEGQNLYHGNQILAGQVLGYDLGKRFHQSDHTITNIFAAFDHLFKKG